MVLAFTPLFCIKIVILLCFLALWIYPCVFQNKAPLCPYSIIPLTMLTFVQEDKYAHMILPMVFRAICVFIPNLEYSIWSNMFGRICNYFDSDLILKNIQILAVSWQQFDSTMATILSTYENMTTTMGKQHVHTFQYLACIMSNVSTKIKSLH
jgi:hypothetical protein